MFDKQELKYVADGYRACHENIDKPYLSDAWAELMGPDGVQIMKPNPVESEQSLIHVRMVHMRAVQYMLIGMMWAMMWAILEDQDKGGEIYNDAINYVRN